MESQLQNPELRNNPENFHPCISKVNIYTSNKMTVNAAGLPNT